MKKLRSRHGFTIVEVMVAFVIFAIMAAMVSSIVSATMKAKQNNLDLEQEILDQKQAYYIDNNIEEKYDPGKDAGEKLEFNFDGVQDVQISYNVGTANTSSTDGALGLDYFVGNVDYSKLTNASAGDDDDDENSEGSIASRLDSRLYGTTGINAIDIQVKKDLNYTSGNRYFFAIKTTASKFTNNDNTIQELGKYFVQCRLSFPGNTVKDCGYLEYDKTYNTYKNIASWRDSAGKKYGVIQTSPFNVRISGKQQLGWSLPFGSEYVGVFVTLENPLEEVVAGTELSGQVEKTLNDELTTINKKKISSDIYKKINTEIGFFTVEEARQWKVTVEQAIPLVEEAIRQNPGNDDLTDSLDALNAELSDVSDALSKTNIYLSANKIFGYSDYQNTSTKDKDNNFYHFKEYGLKPTAKDDEGNWIYETQTSVLGAFPKMVPVDKETPSTGEATSES